MHSFCRPKVGAAASAGSRRHREGRRSSCKWDPIVRVPEGFLVHASGEKPKKSKRDGEQIIRLTQRLTAYPFVIAGRYVAEQFKAAPETVTMWSRAR